jgi:hypothetical protein
LKFLVSRPLSGFFSKGVSLGKLEIKREKFGAVT